MPFLKWVGGKSRSATLIADTFGEACQGVYFEPFAGSGAVCFHRIERGEIGAVLLSDLCQPLILTYRWVKEHATSVAEALVELPHDSDWQDRYHEIRDTFNRWSVEMWDATDAARFIWLNKTCYNGLWRVNRNGGFNVPAGRYVQPSLPSSEDLFRHSRMLASIIPRCLDFGRAMGLAGARDQVYCDPPFVPLTDEGFISYTSGGFGLVDHIRLRDAAVAAAARGAVVLLSNHDLPYVREELYPAFMGFRVVSSHRVGRSVNSKGGRRGGVGELLVRIG